MADKNFCFKPINFFVPLGISFYTFSVASYLIDIYNSKYRAESNFFKLALCVSYFPSIVQGPINRFNDLREQFFNDKKTRVSLKDTQFAIQRILWGLTKKLVIADRAAQVVRYVFSEYANLPNFIVAGGLVFYSIQLYADFAGGIDVALGVSELFGVKLKENFRQPFFSQSIAEFWRRWHITLGAWMKDYVFYPFSLSKVMAKLSKALPSKYLSRTLPMALANILVFLIVGAWHGAEWHFIVYGLFHGGIIAFSVMMTPVYAKLINFFHIKAKSNVWKVFRIVRTFALVTLGGLVDDVSNLAQSGGMAKQLFSPANRGLWKNFQFKGFNKLTLAVVFVFTLIWFFVSLQKEKGFDVREKISSKPLAVRWAVYLFLILAPAFFQSQNMVEFMYARF